MTAEPNRRAQPPAGLVSDTPLLDVQGLTVEFAGSGGTVHAVHDVSFVLHDGESLGIVGESGSGKSVTMQAVMGLVRRPPGRIRAGRVLFQDRDLLALPEAELRRVRGRDIAMVFQDPMSSLNPVLPIGLQLTEAVVEHQGVTQAEADRLAVEMLGLVGIANAPQRMSAYPHQFSGGQLQRVGIAMALACKPSILIADEPTTALDVTIQAQIVELVSRLQRQFGMAIIWISHDLNLVAGFVDRVAVMYAGSIVETAPVRRLFDRTAHPYTEGLLNSIPKLHEARSRLVPIRGAPPDLLLAPNICAFVPRCDYRTPRCEAIRPPLAPAGPAHASACWEWPRVGGTAPAAGPPAGPGAVAGGILLDVSGLHVHYPIRRGVMRRQVGAVRAVDGVSFQVLRGETLALVGESGSGKSTTGRAIMGLASLAGGHVVFDGVDYEAPTPAQQRRRQQAMQMIFQNPYGALNPRMTVGLIVGEGLRAQRLGTRPEQDRRVAEVLDLVGLGTAFRDRYPFELSGGQRQRVGIARALAAAPSFVIADEPISALDVSIQAQIVNLLQDLKARLGLTYLFIGHDLSMVRHLSDRVAVMYLGRIVELAPTAELFRTPRHPYTQALLSAIPAPAREADAAARIVLQGAPPDPACPPAGCSFHPRCRFATELCRVTAPMLKPEGVVAGHTAACHHAAATG